ncbi:uncharacterized protein TEOVI_000104900 [Trypanosoma equiperdum]|uniref:Uncharacterized protein n=1 Tax=Trypanosoma equiperdum TaxID=5694 RepID=A0A1G4IBB5_TRYEQ|nr:hypothetical protein, conserved [Trypanosoma equiperdum]
MNKAGVYSLRTDPSLQDYYDACAEGSGDEGNGSGDESDQDSGNYWRSTRRSPLRGKARLRLYQRDSVQKLLRDQGYFASRGPEAEAAASLLSRPLVFAGGSHEANMSCSRQLLPPCTSNDSYVPTTEERLIFDALCALRQSPSTSFAASAGPEGASNLDRPVVWALRRDVMHTASLRGISLSVRSLVDTILTGSNEVARAEWQLQSISTSLSKEDLNTMEDAFTDYSVTTSGDEALMLASHLVLRRLCGIVRSIMRDVSMLALGFLEDEERQQRQTNSSSFTYHRRMEIEKGVEEVLLPLRRCIHIIDCACKLEERAESETGEEDDIDSIDRASGLMDYLIVRMSALQDSSTMDLYRFYMVLLMFFSWPYVQLITSAIFGFVTKIDSDMWRSRVPRIFRLSFSHIRVGEDPRRGQKAAILPTDILSHVFLCVGHARPEGRRWSGRDEGEGGHQRQRQSLSRAERRAAYGSMMSSRSFILHSFVAFARQRALKGWRRKRMADHHAISGCVEQDEWELCRFGRLGSSVEGGATDALPLASCTCHTSASTPVGVGATKWGLCVENYKTHHNIALTDGDRQEKSATGGRSDLWLHPFIPAARWVTVSLLVPIAQVVQRLQERGLTDLLSVAVVPPCVNSSDTADFDDRNETDDGAHMVEEGSSMGEFPSLKSINALQVYSSVSDPSESRASFRDYMSLFIDIALCRDTERIVHKFLYRLFTESHWWYRCGEAEYACSGTASSFISNTFAEAIKEHPLGQFVRLSVAPKLEVVDENDNGSTRVDCQSEMLRTFAAFELVFTLPPDVDLILVPRYLSVEWDESGDVRETYTSYFWKRRQCSEERTGQPAELTDATGQRARDSWSYCFGYLCSLYYAQISLREQRKRLQRQDVDEYNSAAAPGEALFGYRHRAVRVIRGLGSAYFELSFAVDCLLSFNKNVVTVVACEMEKLTRVGSASSCIALCQSLDALLLRLLIVCFPEGASSSLAGASAAKTSITNSVTALLVIALDPASLPVRRVMSCTRSAVEALVAVVRTLPASSAVRKHVKPLLVLLTFNRFYGE